MLKISVIICTHNPRVDYLSRTLSALQIQTLDVSEWELLLIDNKSSSAVSGRFDVSWHPQARIFLEEELGLTPARLRGIRESKSPLLCFVDDDNLLDSMYLEEALKIGISRPDLGCWGGEIIGEFETPPPIWFSDYLHLVVVRPMTRVACWGNAYLYDDSAPCGAGMCIRREVVNHYLQSCQIEGLRMILDRTGTSTMSGGDLDMAFTAIDMGMGMGRFKSMHVFHLIPTARMSPGYIEKLVEGIAESTVYLTSIRYKEGVRAYGKKTAVQNIMFWVRWLRMPSMKRKTILAEQRGYRKAMLRLSL